jgi:hypothetical protein
MKKRRNTFTTRVLLSLVTDVVANAAQAERMLVQVTALANEHDIRMPTRDEVEGM